MAMALKKGYIQPLPGLTETLLRKYTPDLEATTMGHPDNQRKNIQSTKPQQVHFPEDLDDEPKKLKRLQYNDYLDQYQLYLGSVRGQIT
jgi:hypothetical protein